MTDFLVVLLAAACNRARGNALDGLSPSMTLSRLVALFLLALVIAAAQLPDVPRAAATLVWLWPSLYLWSVFAWDNYWGAAIGSTFDPHRPTFFLADALAARVPFFQTLYSGTPVIGSLQSRLWGLVALAIRMAVIVPALGGLALLTGHPLATLTALAFPLLALPYFVAGLLLPLRWRVAAAEYTVGALIATLCLLITLT